jgi:ribosomal protein L40E
MPSNPPNLTLDEQFFQSLLSAAFTIQEYNDRRRLARQTQAEPEPHPEPEADRLCRHCGSLMPTDASRCGSCGLDEFRPGERLQSNWASMWLMSQEQGLWAERLPEIREGARKDANPPTAKHGPRAQAAQDFASNGFLALSVAKEAAKETITQEETETIQDLYEMATGLPAFSGNMSAMMFDAILRRASLAVEMSRDPEAPASAARLNPNLPVELEQIKTRRWRKIASGASRALRKWASI